MQQKKAAARRTLGLTLIFITAAIWIVSSFLSESLVTPTATQQQAVHPILLTYLATSLFTLYLPLIRLSKWFAAMHARAKKPALDGTAADKESESNADSSKTGNAHSISSSMPIQAAAWAMPIWFLAQLTFNFSLSLTSVTSNTILSSTSSLFTFFLSMWLLGEVFSTQKLLAIIACIAGTALVTFSDSMADSDAGSASGDGSRHPSFWGDILAVVAAALYGGYTVVMRKKMPGEEAEAHVATFFGYVGLFCTVLLAPVIIICLLTGVFSFADIPKEAYLIIVLEGLLDYVLSDYLWARAVMLLGPTVATLGLSVQIPMAAAADVLLGKARWIEAYKSLLMTLGGTALILVGFFAINLSGSPEPESSEEAGPASGMHSSGKKTDSDVLLEHDEELQGLLGRTDRVQTTTEKR